MRTRCIKTAAALLSVTMISAAAAPAAFQDVLAVPATRSPLASHVLLNGLVSAGTRLVAVGQRGHIVYSDDHGASWQQAQVPVSADLCAVQFVSAQRGWAVGHDGVILTTNDGGRNWALQLDGRSAAKTMSDYYQSQPAGGVAQDVLDDAAQFSAQAPDLSFLDVSFENDNDGFVVGAFGVIFATHDGGKTWVPWLDRTQNKKHLHLYGIKSIGHKIFIAGEQGLMMKLDPAAQKFVTLPSAYNGSFFGLAGKADIVLAYGLRGHAVRSIDGGKNWTNLVTGVQSGITGSTVLADGRIVLVSQSGEVVISNNDVTNFQFVKRERSLPIAAVVETTGDSLVFAGVRGIDRQSFASH